MKAAIHTTYGPPEVVKILEVPKPVPASNELLVKVHASTVNRTDCGFRSAEYFISRFFSGLFKPRYQTLGCEFAGEVEAVGTAVALFKPGDKVFGYNDVEFGGHAEYLVIKETAAVEQMPAGFHFHDAAALTEGSHYALCDLRAANVKSGDDVMVYGATGAIGSAAVQLLKQMGANVTAVCGTKQVALLQSLGADVVVDYQQTDFTNTATKFDVIFDAVGKSSFSVCKKLLKPKGIYMSTELGKRGANVFLALLTPLGSGRKVLFPLPVISKKDVQFLKELAEQKKFKPVIDRSYPLDEIVAAYKYVETGKKTGNVIITIA